MSNEFVSASELRQQIAQTVGVSGLSARYLRGFRETGETFTSDLTGETGIEIYREHMECVIDAHISEHESKTRKELGFNNGGIVASVEGESQMLYFDRFVGYKWV